MKYVAILVLLLGFTAPVHAKSNEVNLTCSWTASDQIMLETFVIDLKKKKVFWVNEEQIIEPTEFNEAFIKFSVIKRYIQIDGVNWIAVPLEMKINRLNGAFHVLADKFKTDGVGFCEVGKLF